MSERAHSSTATAEEVNLCSPSVVRALLRRYDVRPSRRWGQSFLIDRNALDRIVSAADLTPDAGVLEIGPGLGVLTRALARRCRQVVAVEIDPRLVQALAGELLAGLDNVDIIPSDVLALDLPAALEQQLGPGRHKVVANIPY